MLANLIKIVRFRTFKCSSCTSSRALSVLFGQTCSNSFERHKNLSKSSQKYVSNISSKLPKSDTQFRGYAKNPLPPSNNLDEVLVDANTYEIVCNETLEGLCDYFDEIVESNPNLKDADIIYGDGVLTVKLGSDKGTYVINRQSPNRQIWLSSPISGPKRYDFVPLNDETGDKCKGYWIYKHDGCTLHELLDQELPNLILAETNFLDLRHGRR